jgi:microcystin-dependent protein
MEIIKDQLITLGLQQAPGTLNVILINGILNSPAHFKLKKQAEFQEQINSTYDETKSALRVKYVQLITAQEIATHHHQASASANTADVDTLKAKHKTAMAKQNAKHQKAMSAAASITAAPIPAIAAAAAGAVGNKRPRDSETC